MPIERDAPAAMRIAVLTNCYPKLSHSFIRNEIAALERQGVDVMRITIRRSPEGTLDEADRQEAARTHHLLGRPLRHLPAAVLRRLWRSPRRFAATLGLALAGGGAGRLRHLAYFIEACRLAEMLEGSRIGHVHVHFGTNPATVARLASRLGGASFSMTVHGPDEFDAPRPLNLPAKIADARFVVAISDFGRSQLLRWSDPAHWSKVAVVRCGVADSFRMAPDDVSDGASDPEDGLHGDTLVCVARLDAQKGLPLLLEAAALVAETDEFRLRIIGDGDLRDALQATIDRSPALSRHVTLLGWRGPDAVRRELLDARAMVLPSFAEGLPVVLMEALALGRPVVATAIAGIPELVDAQTGWLVRAGSVDALADAMRAALRAPAGRLARMGEAGRTRIARDHDLTANAARLATLLHAALR